MDYWQLAHSFFSKIYTRNISIYYHLLYYITTIIIIVISHSCYIPVYFIFHKTSTNIDFQKKISKFKCMFTL